MMMKTSLSALLSALLVMSMIACNNSGERDTKPEQRAHEESKEPPPLETVTMDDEDIVPVREDRGPTNRPIGVPCAWAAIWREEGGLKPLPVGGMVKAPKKVETVEPVLPYRKTDTRGTPVIEVVIDTGGNVSEAKVVQSFDPPWPEGDAAIVEAIRQWKYEPTVLDGNTIPVCAKITLTVQWTDIRPQ
jgi:TonB family protein